MNATMEVDLDIRETGAVGLAAALRRAADRVEQGRLLPKGLGHAVLLAGEDLGFVLPMRGLRLLEEP